MDLALELGKPDLAHTMTEGSFRQWQRFAATRRLPTRRLELYLAQIALTVARSSGGGTNLSLQDFIFPDGEIAPPEVDVAEMHAALDFKPINKR